MHPFDGIIQLGTSLLFAALHFTVEPSPKDYGTAEQNDRPITVFRIQSPKKSTSFLLYQNHFLVDCTPVLELDSALTKFVFELELKCDAEFRLVLNATLTKSTILFGYSRRHVSATVLSPAICSRYAKNVLIFKPKSHWNETGFAGCLKNVTIGKRKLTPILCSKSIVSDENRTRNSARSIKIAPKYKNDQDAANMIVGDLIQMGERVTVSEGGAAKLQFKNFYLFFDHKRFGIHDYGLVKFEVVTHPEHGLLARTSRDSHERVSIFTYEDLLQKRVEYRHDGSETTSDSVDFQVKVNIPEFEASDWLSEKQSKIYTLSIEVQPVDDVPQLRHGAYGSVVHIPPGGRIPLSESVLRVWDADDRSSDVWIRVGRMDDGLLLLDSKANRLRKFNLAQMLNGEIFLASEGGNGFVEFEVGPENGGENSLISRVTPIAVRVELDVNSGLKIPHRSSATIEAQNLTFRSNFGAAEIPLRYVVVDQPKFGLLECFTPRNETKHPAAHEPLIQNEDELYLMCARFTQEDIDNSRVRYRHTSDNQPQSDTFGFQVHCGDATTPIHLFHINFIPIHFRVFTPEPLLLNDTQRVSISARNLHATSFPLFVPPDQLHYHIVEPPKYGMLLRHIDYGGGAAPKYRRIGMSSNFTQQHVNEGVLLYRLHEKQFMPIIDFFIYRLMATVGTSELMRFEINFVPTDSNGVRLVNRTLIVTEGATQRVTNSTIWFETPNERDFRFTVDMVPFNGELMVDGKILDQGDHFMSSDILENRLSYTHCGDETRADRARFLTESAASRRTTRVPIWLSVAIIGENDNAPRIRRRFSEIGAQTDAVIELIKESQRVLYHSALPWNDADWADEIVGIPDELRDRTKISSLDASTLNFHFSELFRDFSICMKEFPELPIHNFTLRDLEKHSLIVRHLNLKKGMNKQSYTISDGKHTVKSTVTFIASAPFIRLNVGQVRLPLMAIRNNFKRRYVLLTGAHLAATTNIDADVDALRFERTHLDVAPLTAASFWRLNESDGALRAVDAFTQRDILARRIFFSLSALEPIFSSFSALNDSVKNELTKPIPFAIPMRISVVRHLPAPKPASRFSFFGFGSSESKIEAPLGLSAEVVFHVELLIQDNDSDFEAEFNTVTLSRAFVDDTIECIQTSSTVINSHLFGVMPLWLKKAQNEMLKHVKFFVARPPRYGILALEYSSNNGIENKDKPQLSDTPVHAFRQFDLESGRLRYINLASNHSDEYDSFTVNVSIPSTILNDGDRTVIGPFNVEICLNKPNEIRLIPAKILRVKARSNFTFLRAEDLRVVVTSGGDQRVVDTSALEYRIMRRPAATVAANASVYVSLAVRERDGIYRPVNAFRHTDLLAGKVGFLRVTQNYADTLLEWELRACNSPIRQAKCSPNAKLRIALESDNIHPPKIIKNEPLQFSTNSNFIEVLNGFLQVEDNDTIAEQLKYLIWQVNGGHLRKNSTQNENGPMEKIQMFSQADIDGGKISFVIDENIKEIEDLTGKIGFDFLVTDGRHQTPPSTFVLTRKEPYSSSSESGLKSAPNSGLMVKSESEESVSIPSTITIEANAQLDASPGLTVSISNRTLRAKIETISPENTIFRVRRHPLHGRLVLENATSARAPDQFTQTDVDAGHLAYRSMSAELGAWTQRDSFAFTVQAGNVPGLLGENVKETFQFRILISFSNLRNEDLKEFVSSEEIVVGQGGSVMINQTHLNLTRLSARCDDALFARVTHWPRHGELARISEEFGENISKTTKFSEYKEEKLSNETNASKMINSLRMLIKMDEFEAGREIIYRHRANSIANNDELILSVYPLREKYNPANSLRIPIRVKVLELEEAETLEIFPTAINIVSGGRIALSPAQFQIKHFDLSASQLVYRLIQQPPDTVKLLLYHGRDSAYKDSHVPVTQFTQNDVNEGRILIEHSDHFDGILVDEDERGVALCPLVFRIGASHTRVLIVRVEPLALRLISNEPIEPLQGRTYILLNRSHFDTFSNGDRSRIIFNVTRPPVNGSLYWVAGETQARQFTQKNIDDGDILYAQLNMNAFQDSFAFVVSNEQMELLEREAHIIVRSPIRPQAFITHTRTIKRVGLTHLNVSLATGISPRFFMVGVPRFGRFFLRSDANKTVTFFTASDVIDGNLFFHAFHVDSRQVEELIIELIAEEVQPARFTWTIDVRPAPNENTTAIDEMDFEEENFEYFNTITNTIDADSTSFLDSAAASAEDNENVDRTKEIDYRFPILILMAVVGFVIVMALSHWRNVSDDLKRRKSLSTNRNAADENDSEDADSGCAIPGIGPPRPLPDLTELNASNLAPIMTGLNKSPRGILSNSSNRSKNDILKSTVYATIGSPNNYGNYTRESIGNAGGSFDDNSYGVSQRTTKNVTLLEVNERRNSKANDVNHRQIPAAMTAAVRSLNLTRRCILPTVNENFNALRAPSPVTLASEIDKHEYDAFGQGYYGVSRRADAGAAPLVALNPAARRFILPSRRPVAVAAVVPSSMATFDAAETTAHVKTTGKLRSADATDENNDDNEAPFSPTSIERREIGSGFSMPTLNVPTNSFQLYQRQTGQADGSESGSNVSDRGGGCASSTSNSALKHNEYWV